MDSWKDLRAMVNKNKQKKPLKNIRDYGKSNKELNILIEKKISEVC